MHIGYLVRQWAENALRVVCPACVSTLQTALGNPMLARVYVENIMPYGQHCANCNTMLVAARPGWPELFDGRARMEHFDVVTAAAQRQANFDLGVFELDTLRESVPC